MGAVSSESLGHPCCCRLLHHRNRTPAGLVTFYVLCAIQLKTRRVHISIPTPNPGRVFMKQVALDLAAFDDSFLRGYSHLIIDRDSKYTTEFREVLKENDMDIVPIPTKSPNCNPVVSKNTNELKTPLAGPFRIRRVYAWFANGS